MPALKKRKRDPSPSSPPSPSRASSADDSADDDDVHMQEDDNVPSVSTSGAPNTSSNGRPKGLKPSEMRIIKESAELYNSNTFHLKIDSLLSNIAPKASHISPLDKLLHELHACMSSTKEVGPQHPLEAARKLAKHGIAVPYPLPLPSDDTNWKVAFLPPSDIAVVGSWGNKMTVKRQDGAPFAVDIAVEMPASLFQEKDYLNSRFFHKRAFYLAVIAESLKALDLDISYDAPDFDARKTCLVVKPQRDAVKLNAVVRIIPSLPQSAPIPPARLAPSQANLRTSTVSGVDSNAPTPLYNSTLALSWVPKPLLVSVHEWAQLAPAFGDALKLLRVWANQRGFGGGYRPGVVAGFSGKGAFWACILGVLLVGEQDADTKTKRRRKTVGRGLSSYQFFKAAIDFIGHRDWQSDPVFMKRSTGSPPFDLRQFQAPVFVDPSSTTNLLAGVSSGSLQLLRQEALATLQQLGNTEDPFTATFLRDLRGMSTRFDLVINVSLSSAQCPPAAFLDAGSISLALITAVTDLTVKALGNRATLVAALSPESQLRPVTAARPTQPTSFLLAIRLDPSNALRLVDHGPAPEADDAAAFRALWGNKAETRRFKDGRIVESLVWDGVARQDIPLTIVQHVVTLHFSIPVGDVKLQSPSLEGALASLQPSGDASWKQALSCFDGLGRTLKGMDPETAGVPLSIISVHAVSESLRYVSPAAPRAVPIDEATFASLPVGQRYIAAMDAVLQFEQSGRWPDELKAIQKMKLVFFERVAAFLRTSVDGCKAQISFDEHADAISDNCSLEVLHPEGFAFRFRIYHNREATLLQRVFEKRPPSLQASAPSAKEQDAARVALALHETRFINAPRHHARIAALSHAHPAYAPTVRLVKRWLAAHFLLPHVAPEAVELIVSIPFIDDTAATGLSVNAPGSATTGFTQVIALLRDWDFAMMPLIVAGHESLGGKLDEARRGQMAESFKALRARDPSLRITWIIAAMDDTTGTQWTANGPSRLVAERIRAVARAASDYLDRGMDYGTVDVTTVFTHPLDDYDFVLQLNPLVLTRASESIAPLERPKAYANQPVVIGEDQDALSLPVVDFDPAAVFFGDLTRAYAGVAAFFYDPLGGRAIGGVWDPSVQKPHPFKVFLGFNSAPVVTGKKPLVKLNVEATLAEMERMGRGLVAKIVRQVHSEGEGTM